MFTSNFLVEIRQEALRRGVWFKVLDRVERGMLSLTARIVDRVESVVLGIELAKIVRKLRDALKSGFVRRMEEFGQKRAREITSQAIVWGNKFAMRWVLDMGFARYLTIVDLNMPSGYGT